MTNFKVTYTIEVEADSAMDAAIDVENWLKELEFRPALEVTNTETGETEFIDMEGEEINQ